MKDTTELSAPAAPHAADPSRFAMSGRAPSTAWRPENAAELADAVRQAAADGLSLVPWGGGVSLSRAEAPERYDVALDTRALSRITIYDPEDFTVLELVQRDLLLLIAGGLPECTAQTAAQGRSCRSGWSCLGLLQHR